MRYVLLILLALLTGCKEKELTPVGSVYHLIQADQPVEVTLTFDKDGRFHGNIVNNYFGTYTIQNHHIRMDVKRQSMIMGPTAHLAFEANYLKALRSVKTFEISEDILILNGDQKFIFQTSNAN